MSEQREYTIAVTVTAAEGAGKSDVVREIDELLANLESSDCITDWTRHAVGAGTTKLEIDLRLLADELRERANETGANIEKAAGLTTAANKIESLLEEDS